MVNQVNKQRYITTQGDMWDNISLNVYGTEKLMHFLIEANHKYRKVAIFPANCELVVPNVQQRERVEFPPWRVS